MKVDEVKQLVSNVFDKCEEAKAVVLANGRVTTEAFTKMVSDKLSIDSESIKTLVQFYIKSSDEIGIKFGSKGGVVPISDLKTK